MLLRLIGVLVGVCTIMGSLDPAHAGNAEAEAAIRVCGDFAPYALNAARFPECEALAETGNTTALESVAFYYEFAAPGRVPDEAKAFSWHMKAAQRGNAAAQYNVGLSFESGRGMPKNIDQAKKWYVTAARQGHVLALRSFRRIREAEANAAVPLQFRWESITTSSNHEIVSVDVKSIRNVTDHLSPGPEAPNVEVWVEWTDQANEVTFKELSLFDCDGSWATLAHYNLKEDKPTESYDRTANAQDVGVKPFVHRIPPGTIAEAIQARVCRDWPLSDSSMTTKSEKSGGGGPIINVAPMVGR